ncbi:glycosyltransferase [Galbitalea sp. SE-J8]|uniref:glycosyltransferase n=1 Tax=Galbitalea sp. SE-J8 TaxID=3054952 RepID=UPI00259CAA60|nr:glycosyltransferase [Galbitalea sp. SE-J8]MDM4764173.1 glycosyltransferase [Galbitalea sp. SE-J8]
MSDAVRSIAMVSMHTSPIAPAGAADAGGMNVAIVETARAIAARGVEVDLVTRAEGDPGSRLVAPGVTLHALPAGPRRVVPKDDLPRYADEFGEAIAQLAGRPRARYDVIHAHYWMSGLAALPVSLELGVPLVQSFHTLGAMKNAALAPGDRPEQQRRLMVEMYLANQADAVVAGSSAEVTALIDAVRAPADRIWVVPPGVDGERFSPARRAHAASVRERLGVGPHRALLVVAGRLQPLKGQDLAVRALAALPAPRPALVLVGEATPGAGPYVAGLRELAGELGVGDDVHFVGRADRDGLADLFATAAATLVPSHSETFGLVALESAASGTPVIASRATGLAESVDDGVSGVLVDGRDPAAWAAAIGGVIGDPARAIRLSRGAREHAERFTWATAAASLLGVYAAIVAARAPR